MKNQMLTSRDFEQTVISLELLTVLVVGPLACLVCYDIAKKNPRANILMTVIATAELYGGASRRRQLPKNTAPGDYLLLLLLLFSPTEAPRR